MVFFLKGCAAVRLRRGTTECPFSIKSMPIVMRGCQEMGGSGFGSIEPLDNPRSAEYPFLG